jgi:Flp pilus assembly protein TadG
MVEFALIAVLLIMVLLSVVEMARMILVYTTMANSARIGVRYAMVHGAERTGPGATGVNGPSGPGQPCTCSQVQTVVKNFASAGLLNTSNLTVTVAYPGIPNPSSVTPPPSTNYAGSPVTVTVSYPYDPLLGYFGSILNKTLSSTSQGIITY